MNIGVGVALGVAIGLVLFGDIGLGIILGVVFAAAAMLLSRHNSD